MSAVALEQNYSASQAQNTALRSRVDALQTQLDAIRHQLAWLKRQLFGNKSEKQLTIDPAVQLSLLSGLVEDAPPPPEPETITIQRRRKVRDGAVHDTGLRFDASVPVRVIDVPPPKGLEGGEIIGMRSTFRLAQRRASFEVLEYRCPVIKAPDTNKPRTTPVPGNVFGGSLADVSFLAGMLVDKFAYHLPLYRQHQRLTQAGIQISRGTLTRLVGRSAALLAPIHQAQLEQVLASRVLAMDETPIKAGSQGKGKMRTAYFWPLYGDHDEISLTYAPTRGWAHIEDTLAAHFAGVLVTDGYGAYARYARYAQAKEHVTHAQCWAHTRRGFERALECDPQARVGLEHIAGLYQQEARIREKRLEGPDKKNARVKTSKPSLITTCRLHGVDPYTYLVDVLQRVDTHPAKQVAKLTPRLWMLHFADNPLRSDGDQVNNVCV